MAILGACAVVSGCTGTIDHPGSSIDGGSGKDGGSSGGGAAAVVGPDLSTLAGLRVPLDGSASSGQSFSWQQTAGPAVDLIAADGALAYANLPASLPTGTALSFRLTVTGGATEDTAELGVTVKAAQFDDFLGGITDTGQLGSSEGIAFNDAGMWVVSTDGFVSRFTPDGEFAQRIDVASGPVGANFGPDGRLDLALNTGHSVGALDTATGDLSVIAHDLVGGGDFGAANYPLPDRDGNIYVSNRQDQEVLRYDAKAGQSRVFVQDLGPNPNAMTFGPEPDRIYIGTVGRVYRVAIQPDGQAGAAEVYLDFGSTSGITDEVDGLVFDAGGNLWVGCPNSKTLYVAPYSADGPTQVARSFADVLPAASYFTNPTFGTAPFGTTTLYYTDLGNRTVARIDIGLPSLPPPLAP